MYLAPGHEVPGETSLNVVVTQEKRGNVLDPFTHLKTISCFSMHHHKECKKLCFLLGGSRDAGETLGLADTRVPNMREWLQLEGI